MSAKRKYPDDDPRRWNSVYVNNCAKHIDPWHGVPADMVEPTKVWRRQYKRASYVRRPPHDPGERLRVVNAVYREYLRLKDQSAVMSDLTVLAKLDRAATAAAHASSA